MLSLVLLGLASCVDRQEFDQLDDLSIIPTVEGSILYLESPERLLNQSSDTVFYSRDFNFEGFKADVFAKRVVDGTVFYEIENTTSKELEAIVEFLDEAGATLDVQIFDIRPAPSALINTEVSYGSGSGKSIEIIKNTSSIKVSIRNLGNNTSVSGLSDPKIIFRSSGKFRIRIK